MLDPKETEEHSSSFSCDNVIGLEQGIRLDANRVERSTCYREKVGQLANDARRQLQQMEVRLFEQRRRITSCQRDLLHLPDSRFDSAEGSIWYHYSKDCRQFILSDFCLQHSNSGESGGGRSGGTPRVSCVSRFGGWGNGIAAKLGCLLAADWSYASDTDLIAFLRTGRSQHIILYVGSKAVDIGHVAHDVRLLIDIAASWHLITQENCTSALPDWSLLRGATLCHEQLENPYARAIFAGEAIYRIATQIGVADPSFRRSLWNPWVSRLGRTVLCSERRRELLAESITILEAIQKRSSRGIGRQGRVYLTSSLIRREMLGDIRRLALVRSEMTFLLAMAIGNDASRDMQSEKKGSHAQQYSEFDDSLLHRFALLSEFAQLSTDYFGVSECTYARNEIFEDLGVQLRELGGSAEYIILNLNEFGKIATLLGGKVAPRHGYRDSDFDSLCLHLCSLAKAIIGETKDPEPKLPNGRIVLRPGNFTKSICERLLGQTETASQNGRVVARLVNGRLTDRISSVCGGFTYPTQAEGIASAKRYLLKHGDGELLAKGGDGKVEGINVVEISDSAPPVS